MTLQTVTLHLPEDLYQRLQRVARLTYRSVEEVVVTTIIATLVAPPDLPSELADELAAMRLLSDDALWAAAQPSLSPAEAHRLKQINHTAGERPLSHSEAVEQETLLKAYHHSILRRAQALAILAQRGHPVSPENLALAPSL